jgi:hypothetical protein
MIYYNGGNVGIGTNNPSSTLSILGQATSSSSTAGSGTLTLSYMGGFNSGEYGSSINFTQRWWHCDTLLVSVGMIAGVKTQSTGNFGGGLTFWTCPAGSSTMAERMRVIDNGYVGIGTTNPAQLLHLQKAGADNYIKIDAWLRCVCKSMRMVEMRV